MIVTARRLIAALAILAGSGGHAAAENWTATRIADSSIPKIIVPETRRPAPDGLPDGLVETHGGPGDIAAAWYAGPTTRYAHGVLGDAIEASILNVRTPAGRIHSLTLPKTEVFEDRYPRLADLDGDGTTEVIAIRSSVSLGAAVTVYGLRDGALRRLATTGFIGLANRWLNIAGIAAFRGGTGKEIAFVQTPHIGGTLFVYAYRNGGLAKVGEMYGFSNHWIGSREMRLSAIADIDGDGTPELAVPSADRRRLRIVGFAGERLIERALSVLPAPIDKAIGVHRSGQNVRFVVGLENDRIFEVRR